MPPNWGIDAGRYEESLTLAFLEKKWVKMNDTINVQLIPDFKPLIANMPSGRDVHSNKAWKPSETRHLLDEATIGSLRAPITEDYITRRLGGLDDADSSDEEPTVGKPSKPENKEVVGAFPGTKKEYNDGGKSSYY